MKKFIQILIFIFFSLSISNFAVVYAESTNQIAAKNVIISRDKLKKIKNGDSYIKAIDYFVEKSDKDKLEKTRENISRVLSKTKFQKKSKALIIIKYLEYKIDQKFYKLETKKEEKIEKKPILLNEEDKEKVRTEVLKLQKKLLDKSKNLSDKLREELEKNLNLEQKGDFELSTNFSYGDLGNFDYKLFLKDYLSKSNTNFDGSFESELKSYFYYNPNKDSELKRLDFTADLEQISKSGDLYMALKNLNILEEEGINDPEGFLEKLKELSENSKFVKLPENTRNLAGFYGFLSFFTSKNYLDNVGVFNEKPLFELSHKSGNKYFLKPTKFSCEKFKSLEAIFDPFYGSSCSEGQYEELLKSFEDFGDVYLEFNQETTSLVFDGISEGLDFNGHIKYTDEKIKELVLNANVKEKEYVGQYIKLEYIDNKLMNFGYSLEGNTLDFSSELDENNRFKTLDLNILHNLAKNSVSVKLMDNKITGKFSFIDDSYDYSDGKWEKVDKYSLKGTIKGATTYDNKLENLYIDFTGKDLENNKENLNGEINLKNNLIELVSNFEGEGRKVNLDLSINYDDDYLPINGHINVTLAEKDKEFDFETYKYNYSGDFKELLKSNITISQREIRGKTLFSNYCYIDHEGWISKERFNLQNNLFAKEEMIKSINNLLKFKDPETTEEIKSLNSNFNIKMENVANTRSFLIDSFVNVDNKQVFKFLMKDKSSTQKKDNIYIEAPKNYIEFEELFEN
ncbi:hypothetical protein CSB07_01995 [Candidatus Gracilibacteria bacterium]|nr:MAG: hypothetical protein CSB07_01995 [Candidatus Gracilibacteria bacterium]